MELNGLHRAVFRVENRAPRFLQNPFQRDLFPPDQGYNDLAIACSLAPLDDHIVTVQDVAVINGERVTLKRFYVEAEGIRLQSANPAMEAIYLLHEELQILGIVTGVIRQS